MMEPIVYAASVSNHETLSQLCINQLLREQLNVINKV